MKKLMNKKIIIVISLIIVIFVIVIIRTQVNKNNLTEIKLELNKELEHQLSIIEENPLYSEKDKEEFGIKNIQYEITGIEKKKDVRGKVYVVFLKISCDANNDLNETEKSLVAYDIEKLIDKYSTEDFITSKGLRVTFWSTTTHEKQVTSIVNGEIIHRPETEAEHSEEMKKYRENHVDTITCKSCGRSFQSDSENAKSIRKTNMCTNCYNNYKKASDALKEMPVK